MVKTKIQIIKDELKTLKTIKENIYNAIVARLPESLEYDGGETVYPASSIKITSGSFGEYSTFIKYIPVTLNTEKDVSAMEHLKVDSFNVLSGVQFITLNNKNELIIDQGEIPLLDYNVYIPNTNNQYIDGGYFLIEDQVISGDQNLIPENIAERYYNF